MDLSSTYVVGILICEQFKEHIKEEIRTQTDTPSLIAGLLASVTLKEISEETVPVPPNTPQDSTSITKHRPELAQR